MAALQCPRTMSRWRRRRFNVAGEVALPLEVLRSLGRRRVVAREVALSGDIATAQPDIEGGDGRKGSDVDYRDGFNPLRQIRGGGYTSLAIPSRRRSRLAGTG